MKIMLHALSFKDSDRRGLQSNMYISSFNLLAWLGLLSAYAVWEYPKQVPPGVT